MHEPYPVPSDRPELLEHSDWMRGLARALVPDASAADDLTQEALALALDRPVQADPKSWLAGTLRNLAAQRRRKDARRVRREREAAPRERLQDDSAKLGELEAQRRLMKHVMALGARDREMLFLRYFAGETPRAIAARQGRSVASVSNQLTRAHAALRKRLEADGGKGAWLGSLMPLLRKIGAGWGEAGQVAPLIGTGPWAAMAWATGKALLVVALLGSVWLGFAMGNEAPTGTIASADGTDVDGGGLDLSGGTAFAAGEPSPSLMAPSGAASGARAPSSTSPSASLTAQLIDGAGAPVPGAALELKTMNGVSAAATTDAQGFAHWDAVPAGPELAVGIELQGRQWRAPIAKVQLDPGEDADVSWTVQVATVIRGVAVDEGGQRLPGQPLQLLAHKPASPMHDYYPDESEVLASAVTDEAGRFTFPPQVAGRYTVLPARRATEVGLHFMMADEREDAKALLKLVEEKPELAYYEVCVGVPDNVEAVDLDATFYTGGAIRGNFVAAVSGLPVAGKGMVALGDMERKCGLLIRTDEEGNFVTPPLPPGRYRIEGHLCPSGWCSAEPMPVARGADDVEVPLRQAATVQLRAEFAPGLGPAAGPMRSEPPLGEPASLNSGYQVLDAGEYECEVAGLRPGRYGFYYIADDGSCAGSVAPMELGPGPLPGGVVIPVVRAATVEVRNRSEDTVAEVTYYIRKMRIATRAIEPRGTIALAVPPGSVDLALSWWERDGEKTVSLTAVSGRTSTVDWE